MKCQILFSGKNKKNIISLLSAEFAHSMVSVNYNTRINFSYFSIKICSGYSLEVPHRDASNGYHNRCFYG